MHEREAAGTELCYADLNGGHDLKICIYTSPQVEKGNWNGPVKGLGKDVPDSTCTFSRNWRI